MRLLAHGQACLCRGMGRLSVNRHENAAVRFYLSTNIVIFGMIPDLLF